MINIQIADFYNNSQSEAILFLLNHYASDVEGGGEALSDFVKNNLIAEFKKRNNIHAFLAFDAKQAVGLCICIEGFSTFACKPLLNIHDMVVLKNYRGRGIGKQLLVAAKDYAMQMGCCKLTLEVLSENKKAQSAYLAVGFKPYSLDPSMGVAEFWQLKIN